jgi:hypothetical protein
VVSIGGLEQLAIKLPGFLWIVIFWLAYMVIKSSIGASDLPILAYDLRR